MIERRVNFRLRRYVHAARQAAKWGVLSISKAGRMLDKAGAPFEAQCRVMNDAQRYRNDIKRQRDDLLSMLRQIVAADDESIKAMQEIGVSAECFGLTEKARRIIKECEATT